jgi:lipoate-protein ligase A
VLIGTTKVCGSAQRRRRGAVLQHGSLLLAASPNAPELPGIAELTGRKLDPKSLIDLWGQEICKRLDLTPAIDKPTEVELAGVRSLALEKYDTARWNQRR